MATTATQELQESFLSAIRRSQEITLQATKVWVETAGYFTPKVSYAHLPFANQLPKAHGRRGQHLRLRRADARQPAQVR